VTDRVPTKGELSERVAELEELTVSLERRLDEAVAKRDEYLDDLKRVAADFENYRKRAARDQQSLIVRAHERVVKELLPVLDDLERALTAATEHQEAKLEDGVRLVEREFRQILRREGLVEIETNGTFGSTALRKERSWRSFRRATAWATKSCAPRES
jgi:molecular chaperone GrpE